jgi:hypothetical protein
MPNESAVQKGGAGLESGLVSLVGNSKTPWPVTGLARSDSAAGTASGFSGAWDPRGGCVLSGPPQ